MRRSQQILPPKGQKAMLFADRTVENISSYRDPLRKLPTTNRSGAVTPWSVRRRT